MININIFTDGSYSLTWETKKRWELDILYYIKILDGIHVINLKNKKHCTTDRDAIAQIKEMVKKFNGKILKTGRKTQNQYSRFVIQFELPELVYQWFRLL